MGGILNFFCKEVINVSLALNVADINVTIELGMPNAELAHIHMTSIRNYGCCSRQEWRVYHHFGQDDPGEDVGYLR
jgi:hypothetical protein